jgi:hypothetical protein
MGRDTSARPRAQARGNAPPLPPTSVKRNAEMVLAIARSRGVQFALLRGEVWVSYPDDLFGSERYRVEERCDDRAALRALLIKYRNEIAARIPVDDWAAPFNPLAAPICTVFELRPGDCYRCRIR